MYLAGWPITDIIWFQIVLSSTKNGQPLKKRPHQRTGNVWEPFPSQFFWTQQLRLNEEQGVCIEPKLQEEEEHPAVSRGLGWSLIGALLVCLVFPKVLSPKFQTL